MASPGAARATMSTHCGDGVAGFGDTTQSMYGSSTCIVRLEKVIGRVSARVTRDRDELTGSNERLWSRLINMVTVTASIFLHALVLLRRGDRVLVVTNPPVLPFAVSLGKWGSTLARLPEADPYNVCCWCHRCRN